MQLITIDGSLDIAGAKDALAAAREAVAAAQPPECGIALAGEDLTTPALQILIAVHAALADAGIAPQPDTRAAAVLDRLQTEA